MKQTPQDFIEDVRSQMRDGMGDTQINHTFKDMLPENCRLFATVTLEPNCSIGYHIHDNETEFYYMTKGIATVNDNGEMIEVGVGDVIMTTNGQGHSIENTGDSTMEMLAVIILD